ncbi:MAG TPA: prolyl oligopeptidase family serine peptidase [Steroidobacteraceae bacterium]
MTSRVRVALAAATVAVCAPLLAAPTTRPLQLADAVGVRYFSPYDALVSFAPDGSWLAYVVCDPRRIATRAAVRMDATRGTAGCQIWARPYDEARRRVVGEAVLVEHDGAAWAPSWSPDGKRLAFYGDDPDGVHVWLWDREQRVSRKVSAERIDVTVGGEIPLWSADGRSVFSKLQRAPAARSPQPLDSKLPLWAKPGDGDATVEVSRSDPAARQTDFVTPYVHVDLALIDVGSGEARRIANNVRVTAYWPSPDGRWLAYSHLVARRSQDVRVYEWGLDVVDVESGQIQELTIFDQFHGAAVRWAPDSRSLAYFSGSRDESSASVFVVGVEGGEPRELQGHRSFNTSVYFFPVWDANGRYVYAVDEHTLWRGDVGSGQIEPLGIWPHHDLLHIVTNSAGNEAWSPDAGATLYVNARDKKTRRNEFLRVNTATGTFHVLRDRDFSIGGGSSVPVVTPTGRTLIYAGHSGQQPVDLWSASPELAQRQRLTRINPELESYTFGAQRHLEFRSRDGKPLKASLLLPAGYVPGRRYPLVVWIYGSQMGSDHVHRFGLVPLSLSTFNMQMLATRGYAVLFPDIPLIPGHHVESLMNAVMPAVDAAIEDGVADAEWLAVMGQSAGGYGTLALITRTTRFKAAIMCAGFGELASFYGHGWAAWLETGASGVGAAPWEAPQLYLENSPVYFLNRIETPLLIQVGADDNAVGEFPKHVFTSLQRLEKQATYVRYHGEGHVLTAYPNVVDFWERVLAFLDGHLRGEGH